MNSNELLNELRALANRWAIKARDFARDAKSNADAGQAQYYRGMADGYYRAATELAATLKGETTTAEPATNTSTPAAPRPATNAASDGTQPAAPAAPVEYIALPVNEIMNMLEYSDLNPRDVTFKPGNVVYALFSRWHPLTNHERIAKIAALDSRIVILNYGKVKDTNDPYVEFAFKQG